MQAQRLWPLYLLVAAGFVHWLITKPPSAVEPGPGVLVRTEPVQLALDQDQVIDLDGVHRLTPLARYRVRARVLSRADYRFDDGASLSPMDLALGWGRMSDSAVLEQIDISQSVRYYSWRVSEFPIPRQEIERSSANTHLIPANARVLEQLRQIAQGHVVELSGYLVAAERDDGFIWRSSLTRNDTGAGACELLLVEEVKISSSSQLQ